LRVRFVPIGASVLSQFAREYRNDWLGVAMPIGPDELEGKMNK